MLLYAHWWIRFRCPIDTKYASALRNLGHSWRIVQVSAFCFGLTKTIPMAKQRIGSSIPRRRSRHYHQHSLKSWRSWILHSSLREIKWRYSCGHFILLLRTLWRIQMTMVMKWFQTNVFPLSLFSRSYLVYSAILSILGILISNLIHSALLVGFDSMLGVYYHYPLFII